MKSLTFLWISLAGVLGLILGSFVNCTAIRLVNGESFVKGRSHCRHCGHVLGAKDLIPLVSWLMLKGCCGYCGEKISPRYLLSELAGAALMISLYCRYGLTPEGIEMILLGFLCLCIACCDAEEWVIPDVLIVIGIGLRVIFVLFSGSIKAVLLQSIIGGLSVALPVMIIAWIMSRLLHKEVMGGGDVKLMFMLGLFFPWYLNLMALILSCIVGLLMALIGRKKAGQAFPFGPALCVGWWIAALFGEQWFSLYMGLLR